MSHIPIHTLEEVKLGQKNRVSCCPICMYIVKNDNVFLNHIVICHYWSSFSCGKCLEFIASSGQQMKKHFLKCGGLKEVCEKAWILRAASRPSHMAVANLAASLRRIRRTGRTRMTSMVEKDDKPRRSESQVWQQSHFSGTGPGKSTS